MSASYRETSVGTQGVIDDIAARRQRLHYLKDRRVSMERSEMRDEGGRRAAYKAWGRQQSGTLAESLMTPKEINLFWGWFGPVMQVSSKYDLVEIKEVFKQLLLVSVFENYDDTEAFLNSINTDNDGVVSFFEITTAISQFDVTTEHVFALRQFSKKLKLIKKEQKKRPLSGKSKSSSRASILSDGSEIMLSKSKSENMSRAIDLSKLRLSSMSTHEDDVDHCNLPLIRNNSAKKHSPLNSPLPSARGKKGMGGLGLNISPFLNTKVKSNVMAVNALSSPSNKKTSNKVPTLDLSCDRDSESSTQSLSPPCFSPLKSPRKLEPIGAPVIRKRDRGNKGTQQVSKNDEKNILDDTSNDILSSRRDDVQSQAERGNDLSVDDDHPPPQPLQTVRKHFRRQLSKMASRDIIDEDQAEVKMDRNAGNLDKRKSDPERKPTTPIGGGGLGLLHSPHDDEDMPTKSLGDTKNINLNRNSLRQKRPSARNDNPQHRKVSINERTLNEHEDKVKSSGFVNEKKENDNALSHLRKTYSRQLSKMSSFAEDTGVRSPPSRSISPKGSSSLSPKRSGSYSPKPSRSIPEDTPVSTRSNDSMDSINSFDSGKAHDILRFSNHSSRHNSSFGETILLRTRSSDSVFDI